MIYAANQGEAFFGYQGPYLCPPPIENVTARAPADSPPIVGSVQELMPVTVEGESSLVEAFVARTADGGSVFDVGSFFEVPQSGELRTAVRHDIFRALGDPETWQDIGIDNLTNCFDTETAERLMASSTLSRFRSRGARTHHLGLVDSSEYPARVVTDARGDVASNMVLIERFGVVKPTQNSDGTYDYSEYSAAIDRGEPLVYAVENIFRLGNAGGSSLQKRYDELLRTEMDERTRAVRIAELLEPYGVSKLEPWMGLPSAVPDYTTKYEAYDRQLTVKATDALFGGQFVGDAVRDRLALCTAYVNKYFKHMGLRLWDLKWEVATDGHDLVVVDTLDPDGVRATSETQLGDDLRINTHFNKQAVRDYFNILHPEWVSALGKAKRHSDTEGRHWRVIYDEGVASGSYPPIPELDPHFAELQTRKYAYIARGVDDPEVRRQIAIDEANYYGSKGGNYLEQFVALNRVPQFA